MNLVWVFIFFAIAYILFEKKKTLLAFIVVPFSLLVWEEFTGFSGWVLFGGGFLALYFILEFGVLISAETYPRLSRRLPLVELGFVYIVLVVFNVFIAG